MPDSRTPVLLVSLSRARALSRSLSHSVYQRALLQKRKKVSLAHSLSLPLTLADALALFAGSAPQLEGSENAVRGSFFCALLLNLKDRQMTLKNRALLWNLRSALKLALEFRCRGRGRHICSVLEMVLVEEQRGQVRKVNGLEEGLHLQRK